MQLTPMAQATVMLTVPFGHNSDTKFKCLTKKEWNNLGAWLNKNKLNPSDLLKPDYESILKEWSDSSETIERLKILLGRGTALGLVLDKWERSGIWIITRSDPEYPKKLKIQLGTNCPSVIFGCGNKSILNSEGIAIVGPRDASEGDLNFAKILGKKFANEESIVISGGARGVDKSAMFGALENEGNVLGILAEDLLKSSVTTDFRKHIISKKLLLISTELPEARFYAPNALNRNRYIYCLSNSSVVVNSIPEKGGTWKGAIENLKSNWVPLWVKKNEDSGSGNSALVQKGGHWIPSNLQNWNPLKEKNSCAIVETEKKHLVTQLELELPAPN